MELFKHNYVIAVSKDLQDKYPANKLSKLFNTAMPNAKGGGSSSQVSGIYYDTEDNYFFNNFNKILDEELKGAIECVD